MGINDRMARVAPGTRIGDYVVERAEDDGYLATHVLLPRRVQLSIMHPTFVGLRPVAVRMMREACILEALRHPGVPRLYEVGVLADERTQRPWIASERVEGESLAATIAASPRLPVTELLAVLRDVAEVLAYAHARNVAHRSIRAEVIVRGDGSRGFPLCVTGWSDARVPEATEDTARAFADDVFALGLVADIALQNTAPSFALGSSVALPTTLLALVDDMLAPNPMSRPSATEVAARAHRIAAALESPDDLDDLSDDCILLDAPRTRTPSLSARPLTAVQTRMKWTPAQGVRQTTSPVAIGALERRRS